MKKTLLMAVAITMYALDMQAQSPRFGINSGIVIANVSFKDDSGKEKGVSRIGLNLGLLIDVPVGSNFSFQPGVNFVQKGFQEKETGIDYSDEIKTRLNYIETPLNLVYKVPFKKSHFFFGAGPSAAFALNGKSAYKSTDGVTTQQDEENMKFGNSDEDDMKSFELAFNIIGGFEIKSGLQIAVNYNRSINNLLPGETDGATFRNNYFGVKIGYMLRRK